MNLMVIHQTYYIKLFSLFHFHITASCIIYKEHTTVFSVKLNVTIYDTLKPKQLIGAATQFRLAPKSMSCLYL